MSIERGISIWANSSEFGSNLGDLDDSSLLDVWVDELYSLKPDAEVESAGDSMLMLNFSFCTLWKYSI